MLFDLGERQVERTRRRGGSAREDSEQAATGDNVVAVALGGDRHRGADRNLSFRRRRDDPRADERPIGLGRERAQCDERDGENGATEHERKRSFPAPNERSSG